MSGALRKARLELSTPDLLAHGITAAPFDVRSFSAEEAMSTLFSVRIVGMHPLPSIDFDSVVGKPAEFTVAAPDGAGQSRIWSGVVSELELLRAVPDGEGLSTYSLTLVPRLWFLSQGRNYRVFQFESELDIALQLLTEWKIDFTLRLDRAVYRARKYKVQYAESDYDFIYRILADVGISFHFEIIDGAQVMVLSDRPQAVDPIALQFHDEPNDTMGIPFATGLKKLGRVRPTRVTLKDRDYRKPSTYELQVSRATDDDQEIELFYYPENFNFVAEGSDGQTVTADDRGKARTDESQAARLAEVDLGARRNDATMIAFSSNDLHVAVGTKVRISGHPSDEINAASGLLIVRSRVGGRSDSTLSLSVEAVPATHTFRPTQASLPRIIGVETATVVGPSGEEIHCDEFGRVRVHFHWDRRSRRNEASSCWVPVSQSWGGAGYGGSQLPRIGQEVLVEFLGGDPDRPVITGRVYTALQPTPYALPANKTQSGLKSASTHRTGGYNEIMFEDAAGRELLRMQAELDFDFLVKRNWTTTVGHDRTDITRNDNTEKVTGNQSIAVDKNRNVKVFLDESHTVVGKRDVVVLKDQVHTVVGNIGQFALTGATTHDSSKTTVIQSGESIALAVGASFIIITPEKITIQSPRVEINPGGGGGGGGE
jgi:type VI secretion system secreted protein VgrG